MSTSMELSGDEGHDGIQDWPSRRNREVPDASDSEFVSSDDKGGVDEYVGSIVHVGSGAAVMGGGHGRGWGPTAPVANLLWPHACRSPNSREGTIAGLPRPEPQGTQVQHRTTRASTEDQRRGQAAAAAKRAMPELNE
jgi:hypothetical protein